ncbi:MAG: S8 family peptidase [Gaiellaceae bacterium]|jgi:subtilisin family serine protease
MTGFRSISQLLDELAPATDDEQSAWEDVLARAAVLAASASNGRAAGPGTGAVGVGGGRGSRVWRPRRKLLFAADALVALAVVVVAAAYVLGHPVIDFGKAPEGPHKVVDDFGSLQIESPSAAMAPDVLPHQARVVTTVSLDGKRHTLYVAPTKKGGSCMEWSDLAGGCRADRHDKFAGHIDAGGLAEAHGFTVLIGSFFQVDGDRLEVTYADRQLQSLSLSRLCALHAAPYRRRLDVLLAPFGRRPDSQGRAFCRTCACDRRRGVACSWCRDVAAAEAKRRTHALVSLASVRPHTARADGSFRPDRGDRSGGDARPESFAEQLRLCARPGHPGVACGGGPGRSGATSRAACEGAERSTHPLRFAAWAAAPSVEYAERPFRLNGARDDSGVFRVVRVAVLGLAARSEFVDDYGHGTAVASLIAANVDDGFGMAGFGGATHVLAFRACPDGFCSDFQLGRALTTLTSLGVRIVNMGDGGSAPDEPPLVDAIHKAAAAGVLIVAAAGNWNGAGVHARDGVYFPAADLQPSGGGRSYGLAVGASETGASPRSLPADFSNRGRHLSLLAPGATPIYADLWGRKSSPCHTGVLVALPPTSTFTRSCGATVTSPNGARYDQVAGTSFAAPEVAGIAALIWSVRPELTNYQVADIIKQSAQNDLPFWTPGQGCGTLDGGAALELATSRPASAWASSGTGSTACSAGGDQPATWPGERQQRITFRPLADKTLRDKDFAVRATASSGLPISFDASGACTVERATIHLERVGTCTLTASQAGNLHHNPAPNVIRSFTIAAAREHR